MDEFMNSELTALLQAIKGFAEIDESDLTPEVMDMFNKQLEASFAPALVQQSINQVIQNFEDQGVTRKEAAESAESTIAMLTEMVYGDNIFEGNKKLLIDKVMNNMFEIFKAAVAKYHSYSIKLPMVLAEGAKMPTYAHETDAAADLYSLEEVKMNAHSYGNLIRTGVKIQLPEGWLALILPRSGMSKETPYRLSNSVGLIDSGYRGELGVLFDNTSDANMYIPAGTRVAQLLVMPSYRFQPEVVDALVESDRGEGGFGSTGTN